MNSESRERIPALVLVDVKVFCIIHGVDSELGAGYALEVSPAPSTRVYPGHGIVSERKIRESVRDI